MKTSNRIQISAPFEALFSLSADIARWPEILPHYRWVKVLERRGNEVVAEMAARHLSLPLWWKTIQRLAPNERRIYFTHIGGITKGMDVYWEFTEVRQTCHGPTWLVDIHHSFAPAWPLIGPWVAEHIIGEIFVKQVANKTLRRIKEIAESSPHPASPHPNPLPQGESDSCGFSGSAPHSL
jgi:ribosome-associated toxin RatA of RatAB toxin-antitoxin module